MRTAARTTRVLHLITRLDPGGSATNTIVSADLLRNHGFATTLAYGPSQPAPPLQAELAQRQLTCHFLPNLRRAPHPWHDWQAYRQICQLLRQQQFDLIHTHTSKAGVLGRLAAARSGLPVVHTPHGHVFYGYFSPLLTRLSVLAEQAMARRCQRIVSLTDAETAESLALGVGQAQQYVTIPSGVPLEQFRTLPAEPGSSLRQRLGIAPETTVFATVARLVPIKGIDLLIRALAALGLDNSATLLIAGDGPQRAALSALAAELGVAERVHFLGHCPDVRAVLAAANAFVLASRNEGMGRALIEAMAAGLAPIATAVGGIPTVIEPAVTGLLVPAEDPPALAAAMRRLSDDPALRHRLATAAAAAVFPRYDQQTMIDALAKLYREQLR